MTDKERLKKIILDCLREPGWVTPSDLAEKLMAHGVTVQKPQPENHDHCPLAGGTCRQPGREGRKQNGRKYR